MAHLAIVGSHSTNGVAAIHSELLRKTTVKDLAEVFPERFNNKTNGVTPRRWLQLANPGCSRRSRTAIGDGWITDLASCKSSRRWRRTPRSVASVQKAKHEAKARFADWVKSAHGRHRRSGHRSSIARSSAFTNTSASCSMLCASSCSTSVCARIPSLDIPPRTFFFAGKAAPAYRLAKLIIKFINNLAQTIDADPAMRGRLKVVFLPDYNVTLAER